MTRKTGITAYKSGRTNNSQDSLWGPVTIKVARGQANSLIKGGGKGCWNSDTIKPQKPKAEMPGRCLSEVEKSLSLEKKRKRRGEKGKKGKKKRGGRKASKKKNHSKV